MNKKLGKPKTGYRAMRKLTVAECSATGLPANVQVMTEHGSNDITFWTACRTGGHDRYATTPEQRQKLYQYWEDA